MRLREYSRGRSRLQRVALWLSRSVGAELDDVAKVSMRRPDFFGRPFLGFGHEVLRGDSVWSVGEREFFAAVVSAANECDFCVGTHGEIARLTHRPAVDDSWKDGRYGVRATATASLLEALTRDPGAVPAGPLEAVRRADVDDAALVDALYVAYMFNVINRVAHALDFGHRSDRDRRRGARILRHHGYRLPSWLLR